MALQEELLEREQRVYEAHLEEWRQTHLGEVVVIKGEEVIGFFPALDVAFAAGTNRFGLEPFFMKEILPRDIVNVSFFGRQLQST